MKWNDFQSEVAHIWATSTDAGFPTADCDDNIVAIMHRFSWELGKMEISGASWHERVAFLWRLFKAEQKPSLGCKCSFGPSNFGSGFCENCGGLC